MIFKKKFGHEVAELIYAVTSELGRNRAERNKKTYPKIQGNFYATALKLADRIANVEYGMANGGKECDYAAAKEYPDFYTNLYCDQKYGFPGWPDESENRVERMWDHLTRLLGDPLRDLERTEDGRLLKKAKV